MSDERRGEMLARMARRGVPPVQEPGELARQVERELAAWSARRREVRRALRGRTAGPADAPVPLDVTHGI